MLCPGKPASMRAAANWPQRVAEELVLRRIGAGM
jgi:hypothetical protein